MPVEGDEDRRCACQEAGRDGPRLHTGAAPDRVGRDRRRGAFPVLVGSLVYTEQSSPCPTCHEMGAALPGVAWGTQSARAVRGTATSMPA